MKKKYFVKQTLGKELNAGPKAKLDTYKTLEQLGYEPIIYASDAEKRLPRYLQGLKIMLKLLRLKNSVVLMENPIKNWRMLTAANRIMRLRNNHLVLLIHDIESERYAFPKHIEYNYFNSFNSIITHNQAMQDFLRKQVDEKVNLYTLDVFDYLLAPDFENSQKGNGVKDVEETKWEVIYCGNLGRHKSSFIYALNKIAPKNWNLNLYGIGVEDLTDLPFIKFHGSFQPDKPEVDQNSAFGLIWDGSSIDCCDGIVGNYMKINNPHKLSLYMALSLPVIVWKEAAVGKVVEDNGLGFTVKNLSEISEKLSALSASEYQNYQKSLADFNKKVTSGGYLTAVLNKIATE